MRRSSPIILLLIFVLSIACNTIYHPQSAEYVSYGVRQQPITDSVIVHVLSPYSDRLYASMKEVIADVATILEKKQPEGSLGNLMADVMLEQARKKYGKHIDFAIINSGGIRLTEIPVGPLTRGKVFELSPFDNFIVLLNIKGNVLKQFLDHVAGRGGWPVSGMKMQITQKKATQVTIGGKPLDETAEYTIALLDYVANGGDESFMLKGIPQQNGGLLYRDQLLEYFSQLQKQGKSITSKVEGRVTTN
ncbi:MAG TPA: 5'-nucleotidase [Chitinophagaceae bacterium]